MKTLTKIICAAALLGGSYLAGRSNGYESAVADLVTGYEQVRDTLESGSSRCQFARDNKQCELEGIQTLVSENSDAPEKLKTQFREEYANRLLWRYGRLRHNFQK